MNFKTNWMSTLYCFLRLNLWSIFYTAIILVPFWLIFTSMLIVDSNAGKLIEDLQAGGSILSQNHRLLIICFVHLVGFIIYKLALSKMFFKKYKKFELIPKFQKVSWKFSIMFYGKILIAIYAISAVGSFVCALFYKEAGNTFLFAWESIIAGPAYIKFISEHMVFGLCGVLIQGIVVFLILKSTLEKHATICKKEYTTLTAKQAVYAFIRYITWKYGLIFAITVPIFIITHFFLDNPNGFFEYLCIFVHIMVEFFMIKIALNKVFFKEYKHFKFIPHIEKITYGLTAKIWALTTVLPAIIICGIMGYGKSNNILPSVEIHVISALSLFSFVSLMVIKLCVEKNADVIVKNN